MADEDRIAEFAEVADLMPDDPAVRFGLAGAYLDAGYAGAPGAAYTETMAGGRTSRATPYRGREWSVVAAEYHDSR